MYFVYMIKNENGDLYIGVTENPSRRLFEHNSKRGALFTRRGACFTIVFLENYETLGEARQREVQIKKWRREKKDLLIEKYSRGQETKMK